MFTSIPIQEAIAKAVHQNGLIVDVRSREEFLEGHIPMAIHVSAKEIESDRFHLPKNRLLILYCESGMTSLRIARFLDRRGYRVINTLGGIRAYNKSLTWKR